MFLLVPAHPGSPGQRAVKRLCVCVTAEFEITSGLVSCFLGTEVRQQEDGSILITEESHAKKVLETFHMHESKPVGTPSVSVQDPENSVPEERVGDDVP